MHPEITILGKTISLYDTMYAVGFIGMFIMCFLSRKRYKLSLPRTLVYTVYTFIAGVAGATIMGYIYTYALNAASGGTYDPNSRVCIFGALLFLPVFMFIFSLFCGDTFRKLMDYMTPGIFFILAAAKFGCLLGGCCYGIADEHGVYNANLDYTVFPVQLYESLCTLAVVIILLVIAYKAKKIRTGSLYPIGMILYCCARFFWENYRYYEHDFEQNYIFGLTFWQMFAVISIIIAIIWLVILYSVKGFKDIDLTPGRSKVALAIDRISSDSAEKSRKKHAEKAKEHEKKAKELKNNAKKNKE
ncbi:MAG: prolipoprotein diacylglyceryl transferase [Clostridiales bacterium]|nr:prolipoprotein diacylglyceryl transferase [Clostridiales bacterium]